MTTNAFGDTVVDGAPATNSFGDAVVGNAPASAAPESANPDEGYVAKAWRKSGEALDWSQRQILPTENTPGGKWISSEAKTYGQAIGKPLAEALMTAGNTPLGLATSAAATTRVLQVPLRIGAAIIGGKMTYEGVKREWNARTGPERLRGAIEAGIGLLGLKAAKGGKSPAVKEAQLAESTKRYEQSKGSVESVMGEKTIKSTVAASSKGKPIPIEETPVIIKEKKSVGEPIPTDPNNPNDPRNYTFTIDVPKWESSETPIKIVRPQPPESVSTVAVEKSTPTTEPKTVPSQAASKQIEDSGPRPETVAEQIPAGKTEPRDMIALASKSETIGGTGKEDIRGVAENVKRLTVGTPTSSIEILRNKDYEVINSRQMMRDVQGLSDADLAAATPADNFYHAAVVERANRFQSQGRSADADALLVELEKSATSMGQNNAFIKSLYTRSPVLYANHINRKLIEAGYDPMTVPQLREMKGLIEKSVKAQDAADSALNKWKQTRSPDDLVGFESADNLAKEANKDVVRRTIEMTPRAFWTTMKAVMQGNMLAPISLSANAVGNVSFFGGRGAKNTVATIADMVDAKTTGHARQRTQSPLSATVNSIKSLPRDFSDAWTIIKKGSGEVQAKEGGAHGQALHPLEAWKNLIAYYTGRGVNLPTSGGKMTIGQQADMILQGTLGMTAEPMLRALGASDAASRGFAMARLVTEEAKLKTINDQPAPFAPNEFAMAVKHPELFFDKATVQRIRQSADSAVFQQQSTALRMLNGGLHKQGPFVDFAFSTVAPYKLTPWNITGEILSYTPLIATARTGYSVAQAKSLYAKAAKADAMGRTAEAKQAFSEAEAARLAAKDNAGKLIVGSAMAGAAWYLYQNGIISPSFDASDESVKAKVESGEIMPPCSINWSAWKRHLAGVNTTPQPGDYITDYFRAGGLTGAFLYAMSNIGRDIEKSRDGAENLMLSVLKDSVPEMARFAVNQSFLKGVSGLLEGIREGRGDQFIQNYINGVMSIPLPNTLAAISRSMRDYKPDIKPEKWQDYFSNAFKNRMGVLGMDKYLPLKRDVWGRPIRETPEGRNALIYHMVDVFKFRQTADSPLDLEVYRLARKTGNSNVVPSIPKDVLSFAGSEYPLNRKLYERYAELVGQNRREVAEMMVTNPNFHEYSDELKIKMLTKAYEAGAKIGKAKFVVELGDQLWTLPKKQPVKGFSGYDTKP